ncbi:MAM and LDL-receptor class A domain-containing 2-like, partial [Brachionus plicatilis]
MVNKQQSRKIIIFDEKLVRIFIYRKNEDSKYLKTLLINRSVVFEGIVGSSFTGDIAIDDIFIDTRGPCSKPAQCSFEDSLCNWQEEPSNKFNLLRITGQQLAQIYPQTSIQVDTTLNNKYGHFLWMNPGYDIKAANKSSRIFSQTIMAQNYLNGSCLTFFYTLNGQADTGSLNIYRKMYPNSTLSLESSLKPAPDAKWKQAVISFGETGTNYEIYVEAELKDKILDLSIDDLYLFNVNCSEVTLPPEPGTQFGCGDGTFIPVEKKCDFINDCADGMDEKVCADCNFENSTCQYEDVSDGSLLWNRTQAKQSNNGPSIDNTLKNPFGHYMQLDFINSGDSFYYDLASLRLKQELKPCSSTCELQFYFHMFGDSDDLDIYLLESKKYSLLAEFMGDYGDRWTYVRIPIGRITNSFQFEIDGFRYNTNRDHDLAIDDFKLVNCEFPVPRPTCPSDYFTCQRKACVSQKQVCDLIDDCGDNSDELNCSAYNQCDFETSLCDWKHDLAGDFKWILKKGQTSYFRTGPRRDHTTGTSRGQYAYMKSSGVQQGQKARLVSSTFLPTSSGNCEVRIFYHMFGSTMGSLNIYLRTSIGNEKILFTRNRESGNYWERADIKILSSSPFDVIIEGIVGNGIYGDIGIDDVSFTPDCQIDNTLTLPTVGSTSAQTQSPSVCGDPQLFFQCKSSQSIKCIPVSKVCNFEADCDDKSDEAECGTCDFEASWCGFYDGSDDKIVWKRRQAPSQNPQGPQVDHTLVSSSQKGSFLITELDTSAGVFINKAVLFGPRLQQTGKSCQVSMWLFMDNSGSRATFFFTNVSYAYDFKLLGSVYGTGNKNWFKKTFDIGQFAANYQLEIFAYPKYQSNFNYTDIAIDDVEFINCSPNSTLVDVDLKCTFEQTLCGYSNDPSNKLNWQRKANKSDSYSNTGPIGDHTTGLGYYALFKPSYSSTRGSSGRLLSSIQTSSINQTICLSFWYHMFGIDVYKLNVYMDVYPSISAVNFNRQLVWSKYGSLARRWYQSEKTVRPIGPWRVVFEGVADYNSKGDIAIDDILSYNGACPVQRSCDFEADLCQFQNLNDSSVDLVWLRGIPNNQLIDHTLLTNEGSIAYVFFSTNIKQNSKAVLTSPLFRTNNLECVEFWYVLSNSAFVNTTILSVYETQGTTSTLKWSKPSTLQSTWRFGQAQIDHTFSANFDYSVKFEAQIVSASQLSDAIIGIDDVNVKSGKCESSLNCNFEEFSICAWQHSADDDFDWLLNQGETDSFDTGPNVDVTLGTDEGVYLFLESSYPAKLNDKAILISDYVDAVDNGCFGLWYFMHGLDVYKFNVYMEDKVGGKQLLRNFTGEQGFAWQHLLLNVTNRNEFRIYLEGIIGDGYRGDIALDDLSYSTSPCGAATSVSVSTRSTTITYPANPVDCNFDQNNTCYWTHDSQADFKWQTNKGRTQTFLTGPSADHTTDTEFGYYLYLEASPPAQANNTARLLSPYFTMSST